MMLRGSQMRSLPIVLLLGACSDEEVLVAEAGGASACLGNDAGAVAEGEFNGWTVTGEVLALGAGAEGGLHPCDSSVVDHSVALLDGDGVTWLLGYGLRDADGKTAGPPLDIDQGSTATLTFRSVQSFGTAAGFVLSDDTGVVVAVEAGAWGPALESGDVPGLTVAVGDEVATSTDGCGTVVSSSLVFTGDDTQTVTPVGSETVSVGGVELEAWALAAWDYEDVRCTDVAGVVSWALFR